MKFKKTKTQKKLDQKVRKKLLSNHDKAFNKYYQKYKDGEITYTEYDAIMSRIEKRLHDFEKEIDNED